MDEADVKKRSKGQYYYAVFFSYLIGLGASLSLFSILTLSIDGLERFDLVEAIKAIVGIFTIGGIIGFVLGIPSVVLASIFGLYLYERRKTGAGEWILVGVSSVIIGGFWTSYLLIFLIIGSVASGFTMSRILKNID